MVAGACSDTRVRPVPPRIALVFDSTQVIRSPGLLVGSVNIVASGGLDFIQMTLSTAGLPLLDTLEGWAGETEVARPVQWLVPPGLPPGTTLRFRVHARDFVDFETTDSLAFRTVP
jgi:hypothetical protein